MFARETMVNATRRGPRNAPCGRCRESGPSHDTGLLVAVQLEMKGTGLNGAWCQRIPGADSTALVQQRWLNGAKRVKGEGSTTILGRGVSDAAVVAIEREREHLRAGVAWH